MMMIIEPHVAVGGVAFGMASGDAIQIAGAPLYRDWDEGGEETLRYQGWGLVLEEDRVAEAYFVPEGPRITLSGVDIFSDPNAFATLCRLDGSPKHSFGFIVLLNLGITMTGFHDEDPSQLAVTAFPRGRWDEFLGEMEEY